MLGLNARIFWLQFSWRLGVAPEEAEVVYHEGERMASRAGDLRSRALLLTIYGGIRGLSGGEPREHVRLGREAVALCEEIGDPALYLVTAISSYALFVTGELREGVAMLDRAIELADGDPTLAAGIAVGCPLAYCLTFKGGLICGMGQVAEARRLLEQGMAMAREHGDLEVVGWGHMWSTWLAYATGDAAAAYSHAQASLEIAERIGDSFSRTWSWYWLGVAEVLRGGFAAAREALERSRRLTREHRTALEAEGYRLAMLAEAHTGLGDLEVARKLAREGLEVGRGNGSVGSVLLSSLALARATFASPEERGGSELVRALEHALDLAQRSELIAFEPQVRVELAELARRRGDSATWERELRTAHEQFVALGATPYATRLAGELEPLRS